MNITLVLLHALKGDCVWSQKLTQTILWHEGLGHPLSLSCLQKKRDQSTVRTLQAPSTRKTEYPFNVHEYLGELTVCVKSCCNQLLSNKNVQAWLMFQISQKYSFNKKFGTDSNLPLWNLTCGRLWALCLLMCQRQMFICGLAKLSFMKESYSIKFWRDPFFIQF